MQLILASKSEGRRQLLSLLNIPFRVIDTKVNEDSIIGKTPFETISLRARLKGEALVKELLTKPYPLNPKPFLILSADSGAILDGALYGKPKDSKDATKILETFSGKTHEFITALYVILRNNSLTNYEGGRNKGSQIEVHRRASESQMNLRRTNNYKRVTRARDPMTSATVTCDYDLMDSNQDLSHGVLGARTWETRAAGPANVKTWLSFDRSFVTMKKLTKEDIKQHLKTSDYTKYAGGYALFTCPKCQSIVFKNALTKVSYHELMEKYLQNHKLHYHGILPPDLIEDVKYSISNIIGLPLEKLIPILKENSFL